MTYLALRIIATVFLGISLICVLYREEQENALSFGLLSFGWRIFAIVVIWVL